MRRWAERLRRRTGTHLLVGLLALLPVLLAAIWPRLDGPSEPDQLLIAARCGPLLWRAPWRLPACVVVPSLRYGGAWFGLASLVRALLGDSYAVQLGLVGLTSAVGLSGTAALARRWTDEAGARRAVLLLAACPLFFWLGGRTQIDQALTAWVPWWVLACLAWRARPDVRSTLRLAGLLWLGLWLKPSLLAWALPPLVLAAVGALRATPAGGPGAESIGPADEPGVRPAVLGWSALGWSALALSPLPLTLLIWRLSPALWAAQQELAGAVAGTAHRWPALVGVPDLLWPLAVLPRYQSGWLPLGLALLGLAIAATGRDARSGRRGGLWLTVVSAAGGWLGHGLLAHQKFYYTAASLPLLALWGALGWRWLEARLARRGLRRGLAALLVGALSWQLSSQALGLMGPGRWSAALAFNQPRVFLPEARAYRHELHGLVGWLLALAERDGGQVRLLMPPRGGKRAWMLRHRYGYELEHRLRYELGRRGVELAIERVALDHPVGRFSAALWFRSPAAPDGGLPSMAALCAADRSERDPGIPHDARDCREIEARWATLAPQLVPVDEVQASWGWRTLALPGAPEPALRQRALDVAGALRGECAAAGPGCPGPVFPR